LSIPRSGQKLRAPANTSMRSFFGPPKLLGQLRGSALKIGVKRYRNSSEIIGVAEMVRQPLAHPTATVDRGKGDFSGCR
jgi:hypothetical protein